MKSINDWTRAGACLVLSVIPIVALSTLAPAFAQQPVLANFNEPGSVIVFPKFQRGTLLADGITVPRTEIEVGAVCPARVRCAPDQKVTIEFHWVCPGTPDGGPTSNDITGLTARCQDTDFTLTISINGKAVFDTEGNSSTGNVPAIPDCQRGYLIGSVIDNQSTTGSDLLVGDALLRNTASSLESYSALAIQENTRIPGQFTADVRYESDIKAPFVDTQLILLTLDGNLGGFNSPTTVQLDFYTDNEKLLASTSTSFICWEQVKLSPTPGLPTNAFLSNNLTADMAHAAGAVSAKGLVVSGQAHQPTRATSAANVSLLALVQTTSGPISGPQNSTHSYIFRSFNNAVPVGRLFSPGG